VFPKFFPKFSQWFDAGFTNRGIPMKTIQKSVISAVAAAMLLGLGGCAGMTTQERDTAIGAGVGGVAGAAVGGGVLGTAAGAVVGGVIGHEVGKPR
jgi:osmotically inducible lipoprotein OsmB